MVLLFHILISFMLLGISLFPVQTIKFESSRLKNLSGIFGLVGIMVAGIGIYIGGGSSFHAYIYITFIIQLIVLGLFLLLYLRVKKVGYSILLNIFSISLVTISYIFYVYYIIASFIYYY
ncbi:hypothetical protein JOC75_001198 [Metabacillus crassostreae]|nr:hypothetical protein [Metabacillus crassostreae]